MQVGINYPWIDYGWDFGDPPPRWTAGDVGNWRDGKRRQVVEDFEQFARDGLFAVRWFLLCDGLSYGTDIEAPRKEQGIWRFDPLPSEHGFHRQLCQDFEFALKTCADFGLKLLPSLIDFHWCYEGSVIDTTSNVVKGGRYELINDPGKRAVFFDNVLEPLLDISMRYRDAIYAWELINEPEWVTEMNSLMPVRTDENKTVSFDVMREFITEGLTRINDRQSPGGNHAFRSTVGFTHWDAIKEWNSSRLGATLHQFHYYAPDHRRIPVHNFSAEFPCIIGEFATTFLRGWPDLKNGDATQTITARLKCVEEKGYPAAFLWAARAKDTATNWGVADRDETISFIKTLGALSAPGDNVG